jgi:hypothetical protein
MGDRVKTWGHAQSNAVKPRGFSRQSGENSVVLARFKYFLTKGGHLTRRRSEQSALSAC